MHSTMSVSPFFKMRCVCFQCVTLVASSVHLKLRWEGLFLQTCTLLFSMNSFLFEICFLPQGQDLFALVPLVFCFSAVGRHVFIQIFNWTRTKLIFVFLFNALAVNKYGEFVLTTVTFFLCAGFISQTLPFSYQNVLLTWLPPAGFK